MGWKPGKLLKKAFKGVRKVAKKIGKGIKKLAFKVFGALGKLGPLGQLALMFVGVPPIFGRMMGAVGSFVQSVAPRVYQAFTAIKGAAQGAFNTITEGIGNGIDRVMNFTKGKGLNLSGDRTSIFGGVSAKDIKVPDLTSNVKVDASGLPELVDGKVQFTDAPTTLGDRLMANVDPTTVTTGPQVPFTGDIDVMGATVSGSPVDLRATMGTRGTDILMEGKDATSSILARPDVSDITEATLDFGIPLDKPVRTFGQRAQDYVSGQVEEFKQVFESPGKAAGEAIKQGGLQGLSGATTQAIMGDPPTQKVQEFNPGDYMTPTNQQRLLDSTTWNGINTAYQQAGAYGGAAAGDLLGSFYNSSFANDTQYQQDMRRLGAYTVQ
jgi:hypothetical protein